MFSGDIQGIDFAPDGTLYGLGGHLYSINPLTGVATQITPQGSELVPKGGIFLDMDYGNDGLIRAVTFDDPGPMAVLSQLWTINPSTGLGTFVGSTNLSLDGLASIPEPSSFVLAAFGFLALAWRLRRRN
jgi:hypothetical protein